MINWEEVFADPEKEPEVEPSMGLLDQATDWSTCAVGTCHPEIVAKPVFEWRHTHKKLFWLGLAFIKGIAQWRSASMYCSPAKRLKQYKNVQEIYARIRDYEPNPQEIY